MNFEVCVILFKSNTTFFVDIAFLLPLLSKLFDLEIGMYEIWRNPIDDEK